MKILALNLPQFHRVKENDEWWGDGFTEWTNVKKAKPIYKGHIQPRVPLDDNYYDLSKVEHIKWQAELAKRFGLSGFVYYHYWYNGKLMLETPCEMLLASRQIQVDYCFCWANHPWTRAWDGKEHAVLQEQVYGGREDWERHFQYLLPFFQDSRYLKKDNKPVFFIYNTGRIPDYEEMIEFWDKYLQEKGFDGIYIIEFISSKNTAPHSRLTDGVFEDEPIYSSRFEIAGFLKLKRLLCKKMGRPDYLDYDYLWNKILNKNRTYNGRLIVRGAFCSFDNSPRRGRKGCFVIKGAAPEKFEHYINQLIRKKRADVSEDFLVINAWNEWGEGAALEPCEHFKYKYLEAVRNAIVENQL